MKQKNISDKKTRIKEYGEVFTPTKIVNDILSLIPNENYIIESRHLEPACGDGNFLEPILYKKLEKVAEKYRKDQLSYDTYSLLAVSSIYGIEIMPLNVFVARKKMIDIIKEQYLKNIKRNINNKLLKSIEYIVSKNIINADAISLKKKDKKTYIVFSEWSLLKKTFFKRRDFSFNEVLAYTPINGLNLFSDLGVNAFIPKPIREYPLTHFLEIYNVG